MQNIIIGTIYAIVIILFIYNVFFNKNFEI